VMWFNSRMDRIHRADMAYEHQQIVNQQIAAAQTATIAPPVVDQP